MNAFYSQVCQGLNHNRQFSGLCGEINCTTEDHCERISNSYAMFIDLVKRIGSNIFGTVSRDQRGNIPGWNDYVKEFYENSRESFLLWRNAGSPRNGPTAEHMRRSRAIFKLALRNCRRNEKAIKAEKILNKF